MTANSPTHGQRLRARFATDSLLRNAFFVMASTAVMSLMGFAFWIFAAQLYSRDDIGVAAAVISVSNLVTNVSLLGLNTALIRFLPDSDRPSEETNAALLTVGGVAAAVALGYALLGPNLTGSLSFFSHSPLGVLTFAVLLSALAVNSLTDAVFIARRRAQFHTIGYTVFGLVRLVFSVLFVPAAAAGVFGAFALAGVVALALSLFLMSRNCGHRVLARPAFGFVRRTRRFGRHNYVASLLESLPVQVVPSLVVAELGGAANAHFSMAYMIANILFIVPYAVGQSLLAEGSNDGGSTARSSRQALLINFAVVLPLMAVIMLAAPWILRAFPADYARDTTPVLQILVLAAPFLCVTSVCVSRLNLQHRSGWVTVIQSTSVLVVLVGTVVLMPQGPRGVAVAFVIGLAFAAVAHIVVQLIVGRRFDNALVLHPQPTDMVEQTR